MARDSLQVVVGKEAFRHVDSFFGFKTVGLTERIRQEHLDSLLPYLNRLEPLSISLMADYCHEHGHWDWALEHLRPECTRRFESAPLVQSEESSQSLQTLKHWFPSDDDLQSELDGMEQDQNERAGNVWFWCDRLAERGIPSERLLAVLERWLRASPTRERIVLAAAVIRQRGERTALRLLEPYVSAGTEPTLRCALADTEYAVRRRSLE